MINIVCWKWKSANGKPHPKKGIHFDARHVNTLYGMLKRSISLPFQLHCITDDDQGIDKRIRIIPLWKNHRDMGGCYVRLRLFDKSMKDVIGSDFFSIDLDTVIASDITKLLQDTRRKHDFKMWGDTHPTTPYNGSFIYMKAGARQEVWDKFDPIKSPRIAKSLRYFGTDQGWIGACLGPHEARWGVADGVYSFRVHFQQLHRFKLNGQERIIFFHGEQDPSKESTVKLAPWIKNFWYPHDEKFRMEI